MPTLTLAADKVALLPIVPARDGKPVPFEQCSLSCTSDDTAVMQAAPDSTGGYCVVLPTPGGRLGKATLHMVDAGLGDVTVLVNGAGGPSSTDIPDALIVDQFGRPSPGALLVIPPAMLHGKLTPAQLGPDSDQLVQFTGEGTPYIAGTAIDASAGPALTGHAAAATPPVSIAVNLAANPDKPIAGVGDTTLSENNAAAPPTPAGGGNKVVEGANNAVQRPLPTLLPTTDGARRG